MSWKCELEKQQPFSNLNVEQVLSVTKNQVNMEEIIITQTEDIGYIAFRFFRSGDFDLLCFTVASFSFPSPDGWLLLQTLRIT